MPANTVDELIDAAKKPMGNEVGKAMTVAELDTLYNSEIARYRGMAKALELQPQ